MKTYQINVKFEKKLEKYKGQEGIEDTDTKKTEKKRQLELSREEEAQVKDRLRDQGYQD